MRVSLERIFTILVVLAFSPAAARGVEQHESFNLVTADGRLLVLSHSWEDSCEIQGTVVHSTGAWGTGLYATTYGQAGVGIARVDAAWIAPYHKHARRDPPPWNWRPRTSRCRQPGGNRRS